jgi:hypothetical protein
MLTPHIIDVGSSIRVGGTEVIDSSGNSVTNLVQGADTGAGIVIGHAPSGASTGSAAQVVSLTTTQRDNLVGADGMLIFNSTTAQFEGYNTSWGAIGGGGGESLSATLALGDTTSGQNILISSGDKIDAATAVPLVLGSATATSVVVGASDVATNIPGWSNIGTPNAASGLGDLNCYDGFRQLHWDCGVGDLVINAFGGNDVIQLHAEGTAPQGGLIRTSYSGGDLVLIGKGDTNRGIISVYGAAVENMQLHGSGYMQLREAVAPGTPATDMVRLYAKSDGLLYSKDDGGTETLVSGGSGGGSFPDDTPVTLGTGSDVLWDWSTAQATANNSIMAIRADGTAAGGGALILTDLTNVNKDHHLALSSEVKLVIFDGNTDVDTLATKWGAFYHDGDDFRIESGFGNVLIEGSTQLQIGTELLIDGTSLRWVGGTSGVAIRQGLGTPEGSVSSDPGSIYLRNNGGTGTSLYVKETGTGNTGWVAVAAGGVADLQGAYDGGATIAGSTALDIDLTAGITIDSTGTIAIGGDADTGAINIGTSASARTTTIGNLAQSTEVEINAVLVDVNSGAGGTTLDSSGQTDIQTTGGAVNVTTLTSGNINLTSVNDVSIDGATAVHVNSSGGAINIGSDADTGAINIGTAGARTVSIGNASATAVNLDASTFSIDSATSSNITVTGGAQDLTLEVSGAGAQSIILQSGGTGADAIQLNATAGGGTGSGIDVNAGPGGLAMDTSGNFSLDATGTSATASNITQTGSAAGTSTLTISSINGGAGDGSLVLNSDGVITVDGSSFSIDSTTDSNVTVTGNSGATENLTIDSSNAGAGSGVINIGISADDVFIGDANFAGDVTIMGGASSGTVRINHSTGTGAIVIGNTSAGQIQLITTSSVTIDADTASSFTVTDAGSTLTLEAAGGGANQVIINSAGTGANAIDLNATAGGITLDTTGAADDISLTSALGSINLTASEATSLAIVIDATAGGVQLNAEASSFFSVTTGQLTLETITSGNLLLRTTTAGNISALSADQVVLGATTTVDIDGATVNVDSTGNIGITADGTGGNLSMSYTGGSTGRLIGNSDGTGANAIDLNATAGGIDLDATGDISLNTSGASSDIIISADGASGALVSIASAGSGINAIDLNASAGGIQIDAVTGFSLDSSNGTASNITSANTTASTNTTLDIACNNTGATAGDADLTIEANSTNGKATLALKADGYQTINGVVALTDNTATTVLTVALATGEQSGGTLRYTILADDATDFQCYTRSLTWAAVNKAGTITVDVDNGATTSQAHSTGTMTVTVGSTTGASLFNIQITADTSLTPTNLDCKFIAEEFGAQALTVA